MRNSAVIVSLTYFLGASLWLILSDRDFLSHLTAADPFSNSFERNVLLLLVTSSILLFFIVQRASGAARKAESQCWQLLENSPQPIWIIDQQDFSVQQVNKAAIEIYGYSREEFSKMSLRELSAPKEGLLPDPTDPLFLKAAPILQHRKKSGESFYVQLSFFPVYFNEREAIKVLAVDIDARQQAYLEAGTLNHKLKSIRNALSASSMVLRLCSEGKVQFMNQKFIDLFGIKPTDIQQPLNYEFFCSGISDFLKARIILSIRQGKSWKGELKIFNTEGDICWIDTRIVPVKNEQQTIEEYIIIGQDITAKKQREKELIQREKLFRSLVDSHSNFLVRFSPEGYFTFASQRFLDKMSLNKEELESTTFQQSVVPEDLDKFRRAKSFCLTHPDQITLVEIRIADKKGDISWSSWEFIGVAGSNGTTSLIQGLGRDTSPQKKAELDLKKYTRRLDLVLDSIGEGFFNVDRNWKLLKVNREFERLTGKERKEILGKYLLEVLPFMADSPFFPYLEAALEEGKHMRFEEYSTQLNKWLEVNFFPYQDGLSGYFRDVSQKKKAELEVKQTLLRYDTLTKATYDTIWEWDLINQTTHWNDGIFRNFNYSRDEIENTRLWWRSKIHPDDDNRVVQGIYEHIEQKKGAWTAEYRFKAANGDYRFVLDRGYVIYNDSEVPVRMIGAMQDVHQEWEYREEIKKLSLVARKTKNSVIITDKDGYIEWVNESFHQLCGYTLEEIKGRKPGDFLQGPQSQPEVIARIRQLLELKEDFTEEIINYNKSGTPYWVRMDVSPVLDKEGALIKFIAIETDITQRKHFEQRLQQQNEQLKEIAWISSHEIRGPVASILGLISLYDHKYPEAPFNKEILLHLLSVTEQLDKVIHRIVNKTFEVDEQDKRV